MKHAFPFWLIAVVSLTLLPEVDAASATRPNVVLMLIDNVGYGDIGCYGNPVIRTPHIDRLAAQGVRCTDFYVVTSSCTPSRGALLTGRYPLRNGLTHQLSRDENWTGVGLPHSEKILPQYLKDAGYISACFGKWNLGFARGSRPTERGFDEFFGCRSGNIDYYTHIYNGQDDMYRGTEQVDATGYSTDLFADAACEFIERNAGRPFFAYVPFNAAHVPNPKNKAPGEPAIWQAPARHFEIYGYDPDSTDPNEGYHAVMSALDAAIGRVIKRLDDLGLRENTLVMLISDNGASVNPNLELETGTNGPFRGGRVQVYEGGIRTACVIRWPGKVKPGTVCHELVANIDILPTILQAAGVPVPTDRVIDGRDTAGTLAGDSRSPHETLFFVFREYSGARQGRWKIVRENRAKPFELYDLNTDPGEVIDRAKQKPEIYRGLTGSFEQWQKAF
ncbi:MAG: sulfatase-like hydrolase/transferase [Planctomycetaceae bacterium]